MRKIFLLSILLGLFCANIYGQAEDAKTYTFKDEAYNFDFTEKPADLEEHFLGEEIAIKMHLLEETYTYIEMGTSTSPTQKTIVLKPTIYYSIKKLNNKYKRGVKKGIYTKEEASENLDQCLYAALAIFYQETEEFENDLRAMKSPEEIVAFYNRIQFK